MRCSPADASIVTSRFIYLALCPTSPAPAAATLAHRLGSRGPHTEPFSEVSERLPSCSLPAPDQACTVGLNDLQQRQINRSECLVPATQRPISWLLSVFPSGHHPVIMREGEADSEVEQKNKIRARFKVHVDIHQSVGIRPL